MAPKNNTTKPLEKVEGPSDMMDREAMFAKNVALALGIPTGFVYLHGPRHSSSSGWTDSPEMLGRGLVEACLKLNGALQRLMDMVHGLLYPSAEKVPTFHIPTAPNLPYEMLLPLFDAQVLDEAAYNRIFEACIGFPLGEGAFKARTDRHLAQNVKPFLDKKEPNQKK